MSCVRFHITLHPKPAGATAAGAIVLQGKTVHPWHVPLEERGQGFPMAFEQAAARLQQLPRAVVEPDGSFAWVSRQSEPAWQLDGVLFEREGRLWCLDLQGEAHPQVLQQLLDALGICPTTVLVQLSREGVFLEFDEFVQYVWGV